MLLPAALLLCMGTSWAVAEDGWVLYAPAATGIPAGQSLSGAEYVEALLSGYTGEYRAANTTTPEGLREQCVERIKGAVTQLGHTLNGFAYDLEISVHGAVPPYVGVSCRIQAESNLSVTIEIKED